jgi:hypothetical protein
MSTNVSEDRNRCAIRELKPGRATPQQIQNYPQSSGNNGRKLVRNGVFKQIPGSIKRDTSLPGKTVDNLGFFIWLATFVVFNLGEAGTM